MIERRELPGGLNTYGVAEYKLRAADSVREVEMIRRLGVEFRCGVEVDSAAALEALEAEFDFHLSRARAGRDAAAEHSRRRHQGRDERAGADCRIQDRPSARAARNGGGGGRGKHGD